MIFPAYRLYQTKYKSFLLSPQIVMANPNQPPPMWNQPPPGWNPYMRQPSPYQSAPPGYYPPPQPPPQPQPPQQQAGGGLPYIGARISLISNMNIRYEGILYTIDPVKATVALQNVRCFGTEGRASVPDQEVPASPQIYRFLIFGGNDIKDLHVSDPPAEQQRVQPPPPQQQPPPQIQAQAQPQQPPQQQLQHGPQPSQPPTIDRKQNGVTGQFSGPQQTKAQPNIAQQGQPQQKQQQRQPSKQKQQQQPRAQKGQDSNQQAKPGSGTQPGQPAVRQAAGGKSGRDRTNGNPWAATNSTTQIPGEATPATSTITVASDDSTLVPGTGSFLNQGPGGKGPLVVAVAKMEDFNFTASNQNFDKDAYIKSLVAEAKKKDPDAAESAPTAPASGGADLDSLLQSFSDMEVAEKPMIAPKYDKKKSFFDDITTDSDVRGTVHKEEEFTGEDADTFGDIAKGYRSRHNRYGGGGQRRGGRRRGGGRGGGGMSGGGGGGNFQRR
eukprot:gb/GEZN01005012.1/.p1 GENE.gb/GEZN01005012.1/~~gb/GEZN01005012.1/.p1  ORF type:complete len:497 (-),score=76.49 gb/GEZN01005012.1/:314-1804(-)